MIAQIIITGAGIQPIFLLNHIGFTHRIIMNIIQLLLKKFFGFNNNRMIIIPPQLKDLIFSTSLIP